MQVVKQTLICTNAELRGGGDSSLTRRWWVRPRDATTDDLPGHSFHLPDDINTADEFEGLSRFLTWPQQHQAQNLAQAQRGEAGARTTTNDS